MFLSLLDLMRQQTGWPLPESAALVPRAGVTGGYPRYDQAPWDDEGADLVWRLPLTGIDPRSVQVQVSETSLSLAGHRTHEERVEGEGFVRSSASYGAFARTLPLPVRVLPRESKATWTAGEVLEIRLRKA